MTDIEAELPPRVDWQGNERPASAMETTRAVATASRIRGEVAEIRVAADQLADGTPTEAATAAFLRVQALLLERNGGTPRRAEQLGDLEDTREDPGYVTTPARSALLIARAHNSQKDTTP